jgi:hypothetical protein
VSGWRSRQTGDMARATVAAELSRRGLLEGDTSPNASPDYELKLIGRRLPLVISHSAGFIQALATTVLTTNSFLLRRMTFTQKSFSARCATTCQARIIFRRLGVLSFPRSHSTSQVGLCG